MRAALAAGVLAVLLLGAAVPAAPSVLVLGDSYASGEGLPAADGVCGTEAEASWGALVARELGADELRLSACSGAAVADLTTGGALGRDPQLAALGGPADLVLLTIGGNDLGFTDIVADCLGFAELEDGPVREAAADGTWADLGTGRGPDRGCDVATADLRDRIASFAAPERFPLPDGASGDLAAVYVAVARGALAEGGRLVVVGYPALFAEPDRWPERYGQRCHGLRAADAAALGEVVAALDAAVADAVRAANQRLGAPVVQHVDVMDAYTGAEGEDHRLCGGGVPWMNGLTVGEGGIDIGRLLGQLSGGGGIDLEQLGARPSGSFHPGTAGHRGIADAVLAALTG